MQNRISQIDFSESVLAFKMLRIRRKIEEFNSNNSLNSDEEYQHLLNERKKLLNQYYDMKYGNVVCLI